LQVVATLTAPSCCDVGHLGAPPLVACILFHHAGPVARPRRFLFGALARALGVSIAAAALAAGLALILPPLIVNRRFTGLNTLLQAASFLALAFVALAYRRARNPDRRIERCVIAALILVRLAPMSFMLLLVV